MSGHRHDSSAGTQNQGNTLGSRSCVRQSKLYRQYESGNSVKDIMGTPNLRWDTNKMEGAYEGQAMYDHNIDGYTTSPKRGQNKGYMQPRGENPKTRDYETTIGGSNSHKETRSPARAARAPPPRAVPERRSPAPAPVMPDYEEDDRYASNGPSEAEIRAAIEEEAMKRMHARIMMEKQQQEEELDAYSAPAPQLSGNHRMAVKYDEEGQEVRRTFSDASPPRRSGGGGGSGTFSDAAAQADFHLAEYEKFKRMAAQDTSSMRPSMGRQQQQQQQGNISSARRANRDPMDGEGGSLSVVGYDSGGHGDNDMWKRSSNDIGGSGMPLKSMGKPWDSIAPTSRGPMTSRVAAPNAATRPW